ncbi:IS21 family transposase [Neomoorella humiferrea]|uniref:IS21 family transposase n=1 Tax=Neomoorella humiferrea TaxID=676965 RepID=UPI0030CEC0FD
MVQVDYIRYLYYQEHKSIRSIAKLLGNSRKTVRKVLRLEDLRDYTYHQTAPRPRPVMGPYIEIIKTWLEEDKSRPRKQRHTARRIYNRLKDEYGFNGSEESVRRVVRELKQAQAQPEVYIPLEFALGEAAQCDWGEAEVILDNQKVKVYLFCLRLCASRVSFVRAYLHPNQEAFLEGHRLGFEFFGGVPKKVIYDNLTLAVKKVLAGTRREEQEAFLALRGHYVFVAEFCNVTAGHEKGQIENLVGYARRNFLVPVPQCASLEELNGLLRQNCLRYTREHRVPGSTRTIAEVWEEEKKVLLPLPPKEFGCYRQVEVRADSYSRVRFETTTYSVPQSYARQQLVLKAYVDKIEVWARKELIATHPRSYGKGEEHLDPRHYLKALERKPRALGYARPLKNGTLPLVYSRVLAELAPRRKEGLQEFQRILGLEPLFGLDLLTRALEATYQQDLPRTCLVVREVAASIARTGSPPLNLDITPLPASGGSTLQQFDALVAGR